MNERSSPLDEAAAQVARHRALHQTDPRAHGVALARWLTRLGSLIDNRVTSKHEVSSHEVYAEAVAVLRPLYEADPVSHGYLFAAALVDLATWIQRPADALKIAREAAELADRHHLLPLNLRCDYDTAPHWRLVAELAGKAEDTDALIDAGGRIVDECRRSADLQTGAGVTDLEEALEWYGRLLVSAGQPAAGLAALREYVTLKEHEAMRFGDHCGHALALEALARNLEKTGDRQGALDALHQALDLYRRQLDLYLRDESTDPSDSDVSHCAEDVIRLLRALDRDAEADRMAKEWWSRMEEYWGLL